MSRIQLENVKSDKVSKNSIVIVTIELGGSLLAAITPTELESIKIITSNAATLVWLTNGALYKGRNAEQALIFGFCRALMLEQPSLKLFAIDYEDVFEDLARSTEHTLSVLDRALHESHPDFEYWEHDGFLFVSRFVAEEPLNRHFRAHYQFIPELSMISKDEDYRMFIVNPGQLDTVCFSESPSNAGPLDGNSVKLHTSSVALDQEVGPPECF